SGRKGAEAAARSPWAWARANCGGARRWIPMFRLLQKLILRYGPQRMRIAVPRARGVRSGERCRVYTSNFGGEPWLIRIGNHVCICNDVTFVNHDLNWPFQDRYDSLTGFGAIEIKDNSQIGVGAIILPRVTIGPNAL